MDGNQVLKPQEISATVKHRTAPPATGSAELVKYVLVELDVFRRYLEGRFRTLQARGD